MPCGSTEAESKLLAVPNHGINGMPALGREPSSFHPFDELLYGRLAELRITFDQVFLPNSVLLKDGGLVMFVGWKQCNLRVPVLDGPSMQCKIKQQVAYQHQPEFVARRSLKVSAGFDPQLPHLFGKVVPRMKCTSKASAEKSQFGLKTADIGGNRNGLIHTFQHEALG
jgi:hypothetical protein